MTIRITHMTRGLAGLIAENSVDLHAAIAKLRDAGYVVDGIDDDAAEPRYCATVHYTLPQAIRTIQQLVGAAGAYQNKQ